VLPRLAGQGTNAGAAQADIPAEGGPANGGPKAANQAWAQAQHYVVLVSLDGFRWDYAQRDGAAHLLALGKQGAWAPEGMMPSYPALSFPNHYSMATGLYPGRSGIVAGSFYDPARQARFAASDPETAGDGSWYGGTPLWSLAESRGMRTACILWPGCAAKIAGYRPAYALDDGEKADGEKGDGEKGGDEGRVRQALDWLRLPAAERPHFIALSFSEPGREGRRFGPDAPQTRAAALRMDALVGKLKAGLDATGLPVDLVVVSGEGMARSEGGWITLDQFTHPVTHLGGFETDGPLLYGKTEEERERVYDQLKHVSSLFVVYRLKNAPAGLHANRNAREGDPVAMATGPYAIRAHGPPAGTADAPPAPGVDGFDPRTVPEMKGIFFAAGPDIVKGRTVAPFENVNLYPWLAHLLGLTAPKNDGDLNILAGTLRDDGEERERGRSKHEPGFGN
jgi:alkaline phosphatase D